MEKEIILIGIVIVCAIVMGMIPLGILIYQKGYEDGRNKMEQHIIDLD